MAVFCGVMLDCYGIFARIITIQFVEHDHWSAKGAEYTQSIKSIKPYRGQILAREEAIAISVPTYNLSWDSQCEGMEGIVLQFIKTRCAQGQQDFWQV